MWEDLRTVSMVVSERRVAGEEATTDVRYYIGSKPGKAKEYAGQFPSRNEYPHSFWRKSRVFCVEDDRAFPEFPEM